MCCSVRWLLYVSTGVARFDMCVVRFDICCALCVPIFVACSNVCCTSRYLFLKFVSRCVCCKFDISWVSRGYLLRGWNRLLVAVIGSFYFFSYSGSLVRLVRYKKYVQGMESPRLAFFLRVVTDSRWWCWCCGGGGVRTTVSGHQLKV